MKDTLEDIVAQINSIAVNYPDFRMLVNAIDFELDSVMSTYENTRLFYHPKPPYISINVPAIPLTPKESSVLEKYLELKYLPHFTGDIISIKKRFFRKYYIIESVVI